MRKRNKLYDIVYSPEYPSLLQEERPFYKEIYNIIAYQCQVIFNKKKLVYGVGLDDSEYKMMVSADGIQILCPIYNDWYVMIRNCYSDEWHDENPQDDPNVSWPTVCLEWRVFSQFKFWLLEQGDNWDRRAGWEMLKPSTTIVSP